MLKYSSNTKPLGLKNDFITVFDTMFDEMMKSMYPEQSKNFNKDFFLKGSYPKCNVFSSKESLFIEAAVPGLSKDQLEVFVKDGILSINGSSLNKNGEDKTKYIFREIKKSSFQRSFRLSDKLDHSSVKASTDNGILTISIDFLKPNEPESKTYKVDIGW